MWKAVTEDIIENDAVYLMELVRALEHETWGLVEGRIGGMTKEEAEHIANRLRHIARMIV
jgi:hypothetical protein